MKLIKILTLLAFIIFSGHCFAVEYLELSKKLAQLRTTVEQLSQDLSEVRKSETAKLRSYSLQRAELESSIRKEEIKNKQFQEKMINYNKKFTENHKVNKDLSPIFTQYSEKLNQHIETTFPYKKTERLQHVKNLQKEFKEKQISTQQALTRLWSAYEDEHRFTKENQISKQSLLYNGKSYQAELVKLGSMKLFFQLKNGITGQALLKNDNWVFTSFNQAEQIQAVQHIFDGFKKQIRSAEYTIPQALNTEEEI